MSVRPDIAVAGGGPAGSLAALLLQRAGARVALVDSGRARPRLEGLSPRVVQILAGLGVDCCAVSDPVVRKTAWGELGASPNREHIVERREFDRQLRETAERAGVTLVEGDIRHVCPGRVTLSCGATISAGLVIEARGRRAQRGTAARRGPASISVAGRVGPSRESHAAILAASQGWVWQAGTPKLGRWTQVVVDADTVDDRQDLVNAWRTATSDPYPETPLVRACDLRLNAPRLDPKLPAIGDAAIAMDPLSGHGVYWAISSALFVPPLVKALSAGRSELARRFYRDRVVETFWRQARIGRDFHRLAGHRGPFWDTRSRWPDAEPSHAGPERPHLETRICIRDGDLVALDTLVSRRDPAGAAFVLGHEIVPLLRRLGTERLPDRDEFCRRIAADLPPADAVAIHGWLIDRGVAALPRTVQPLEELEEIA